MQEGFLPCMQEGCEHEYRSSFSFPLPAIHRSSHIKNRYGAGCGITWRSEKVRAKNGDQETRGHRSRVRPLNSRGSGPSTVAPAMRRAAQLVL